MLKAVSVAFSDIWSTSMIRPRAIISSSSRGMAVMLKARLSFAPHGVGGGEFSFDIGTAGSTTLVLQTLIPALLFCGENSRVTVIGGTHVPFSPSYHYLAEVFAPFLRRVGAEIRLGIDRSPWLLLFLLENNPGAGNLSGMKTIGRGRRFFLTLDGCK